MSRARIVSLVTALTMGLTLLVAAPSTASVADGAPVINTEQTVAGMTGDVTLAWDYVRGAGSYKVEISTTDTFATVLDSATTTGLRWVPTKELGGATTRTLYWRVTALGATTAEYSSTSVSETQNFDRGPAPVPTVETPQGAVDYPTAVAFTWKPVAGATGYTLQYGQDASFTSGVTTTSVVGTAYAPTTMPFSRGINYFWRVAAKFSTGTGAYSSGTAFSVTWSGSQPTHLVPTSSSSADTTKLSTWTDLNLSWDTVPGAKYYKVEVSTGETFATTDLKTIAGASAVYGTSLAVETQLGNGTYFWRVTAYDANGSAGVPSTPVKFRRSYGAQQTPEVTDLGIVGATDVTSTFPVPQAMSSDPAAPTALPSDAIELAWKPVPRASHYQVEVVASGANFDTTSAKLSCYTPYTSVTPITAVTSSIAAIKNSATCLSSSSLTLVSGVTYKWRVRALDLPAASSPTSFQTASGVASQWSDPMVSGIPQSQAYFTLSSPTAGSATTPFPTAPVKDSQVSQAPVMRWSAASTVVVDGGTTPQAVGGYKIDVSRDASFTQYMTYRTAQPSLRINGSLGNDTTVDAYYWRVYACTGSTSSAPCGSDANLSNFKRQASAPVVNAPEQSSVDGTVRLSWSPMSVDTEAYDGGTQGYEVAITKTDGDTPSGIVTTFKTDTPFADLTSAGRGLTNGTTYYVYVRALGPSGEALAWSSPKDFVKVGPVPAPVDNASRSDRVLLQWSAAAGTSTYTVTYSGPSASTVSSIKGTAVTLDGLTPGTYTWSVQPTDAFGTQQPSSPSGTFTVGSSAVQPNAVAAFTPENRTLSWTLAAGQQPAAGYQVELATNDTFTAGLKTATTVAQSYTPTSAESLVPGTTYFWRVFALTANGKKIGTTAPSSSFTVESAPTVDPTPTASVINGVQIAVSWTKLALPSAGSSVAPTYLVRYQAAGADGWTVTDPIAGASVTFMDGITEATTYSVQVLAMNDWGTSPWSAAKSVTTQSRPNDPTTVTASSITPTSMKLAWKAPASASGVTAPTGYKVAYVPTDASGTPIETTTTTTSLTLSNLTPGTSYDVDVWATNAVGQSDGAATGTFSTTATPTRPTALLAVAGDKQVTVTWAQPESTGTGDVTSYTLQRSTYSPSTSTWSTWTTVTKVTSPYVVTGLTNGTQYRFQVAAVNGVGTGPYSNEVTSTPLGVAGAPTSLSAKAGDRSVALSWSAPSSTGGSPVTSYSVERSAYSNATSTWGSFAAVATVSSTTATLTGLTNGTRYQFRVTAKNVVGSGAYSSAVVATPLGLPSAPSSVRAARGNGAATVTWVAPSVTGGSDILGYTVQKRSYSSSTKAWTTWTSATTAVASARSVTITGLTNGTSYQFQVLARTSVGTSAASSAAAAVPASVASAPSSVKVSRGDAKAVVTWAAPSSTGGSAILGFTVQKRGYSSSKKTWTSWATATTTAATTRSVTISGLTNGTSYEFRVLARNTVGSGAASTAVGAVPAGKPKAPTSVKVTAAKAKAKISWKKVAANGSTITSYKLQYSTSGKTWKTLKSVTGSTASYTWTKAKKGKKYYVRVVAYNGIGASPASSKVKFTAK